MGGGGGDGGAAQARADEQARQDRIRKGTQEINNLFDGYTKKSALNPVNYGTLEAGKTYFDNSGNKYTYQPVAAPLFGRNPGRQNGYTVNNGVISPRYTDPAPLTERPDYTGNMTNPPRQGEDIINSNIQKEVALPGLFAEWKEEKVPGQFGDSFFGQRRQAYLDYAVPQLNDQFEEARQQLVFSLDRSGMSDSSVRAKKEADLQKLYDQNRQSVADKALGYETQARTNIEDARANLIATLNATGDAQGAVNSAITRAKALSAPDTYDPLAGMFSTFTSTLGQQAAAEKAAALANSYSTSGGAGLFGPSKKSVKTTG